MQELGGRGALTGAHVNVAPQFSAVGGATGGVSMRRERTQEQQGPQQGRHGRWEQAVARPDAAAAVATTPGVRERRARLRVGGRVARCYDPHGLARRGFWGLEALN